jgi:predicted MFS family arabinose efflux permease
MATVAIVLGILGICISWVPTAGWSGLAMGIFSCVMGLRMLTAGQEGQWHKGSETCALLLGIPASSLSLAYQVKHADGALDRFLYPLPLSTAAVVLGLAALAAVFGIVTAKKKVRSVGLVLASLAVAALSLSGAFALTTADREYEDRISAGE